MKVVVFGGSGTIGRAIAREALDRGHEVTIASRNPARFDARSERLAYETADVTKAADVTRVVLGHDAVISAV